ncbi:major histocompatibility complex class I-related gene protein-like [Clupea harengus]|uniref:Major histocompatibility complex class I-related gene protein-like n=1 Tax=Clupea harengus TaxID=7950 RepID=A0A8M1KNX6_CLUHA|nr:major histocompatibility complex class I-related gene protein-like [Clupea harengus]
MTFNIENRHSAIAIPGSRPLYDHFSGGTNLFFSAKGVHTLQRLAGCELLDDDTPGPLRELNAFNGVKDSVLQFNVQQKALQIEGFWQQMWSQSRQEYNELMFTQFYSPICIKILKNCLHMKKNYVMRKVKPRVRLLQKTLPDSGGVKVTCLATGFYPRHINLTLLRDGQPVSDHQITGGELLPNLDGTYQMRKSLEVSTEELRVKHPYSCTVEHLSLDNKLDVKPDLDPSEGTVSIVIPVVVLGVALLCVVGAVVFMRRRRHK